MLPFDVVIGSDNGLLHGGINQLLEPLLLVQICGIYWEAIPHEMLNMPIFDLGLDITNLRRQPHLSGSEWVENFHIVWSRTHEIGSWIYPGVSLGCLSPEASGSVCQFRHLTVRYWGKLDTMHMVVGAVGGGKVGDQVARWFGTTSGWLRVVGACRCSVQTEYLLPWLQSEPLYCNMESFIVRNRSLWRNAIGCRRAHNKKTCEPVPELMKHCQYPRHLKCHARACPFIPPATNSDHFYHKPHPGVTPNSLTIINYYSI